MIFTRNWRRRGEKKNSERFWLNFLWVSGSHISEKFNYKKLKRHHFGFMFIELSEKNELQQK